MRKKCCIAVACCLLAVILPLQAQHPWLLHRYDETNSQLQGHPTMMLQDRSGLLWIATWNGLCRFDGYEFRPIKPQAGDGCSMSSDRLRDIWLAENGDIYCRTDDGIFRFDIKTYRFSDLPANEVEQANQQRHHQQTRGNYSDGTVSYVDQQGLEWQLSDDALCCFNRSEPPTCDLAIKPEAMVRCMHQDSKGRIWVATKEDAAVRLYDQQLNLLGYLSPNGRIQSQPVSFGTAVYSFAETTAGTYWLGSKPNGLYRLRESSPTSFSVDFIDDFGGHGVYDIKPDRHRDLLWIATLGGGICCVQNCREEHPKVVGHLGNYPSDACQNVRFIHLVEGKDGATDYLVAATTEGLVVGKLGRELSQCQFRRHVKEPLRPTSLSCNATMDIAEDQQGYLYVSTETDGICQLLTTDLWADTLSFRNYDILSGHLPNDMTLSVCTQPDGHLLITSQTQFILLDTRSGLSQSFGHRFFHRSYRFSEARPLTLADGRWLFATTEGAFTLEQRAARKSGYQPPLVITGISIQGGTQGYANNACDTLLLSPSERSLTIRFAALDYAAPEAIRYQFRMGNDTATWNNLGHEHAVTLLDLKPGTYLLALRSTNADGQWTQNVRMITIICRPTFWETPWATLLFLLMGLLVVGIVAYTYLYIRGIKRKQHETLEAYLALLNNAAESTNSPNEQSCVPQMKQEDDAMMRRIMAFIEENIGNGDASVGDMAAAAATSRSGLQRKLKQTMGITPQDLLREARIKHACQLLRQTTKTVAEVAYSCGFSDPKYFSRCFKQSIGMSPTDYKNTI